MTGPSDESELRRKTLRTELKYLGHSMGSFSVFAPFFPLICMVGRGFLDGPPESFEDVACFRLRPAVDMSLIASRRQIFDIKVSE